MSFSIVPFFTTGVIKGFVPEPLRKTQATEPKPQRQKRSKAEIIEQILEEGEEEE